MELLDFCETLVKVIGLQTTPLTTQGMKLLKKKSKNIIENHLNTLPKDEFVYGYLYGFTDYNFQSSAFSDKMSWMTGSTAIFSTFYGPSKAVEILRKSSNYMTSSKKFMDGVTEGSEDAKRWINKGSPAVGLAMNIEKI